MPPCAAASAEIATSDMRAVPVERATAWPGQDAGGTVRKLC
jgi:hypothetical protein